MIARFKHNYFSLATLLAALVFASIEIATSWAAGAHRIDLNTALGLLSRQLATMAGQPDALALLAYQIYLPAACVLVGVFLVLLYRRIDPGARHSPAHDNGLIVAQLFIAMLLDAVPLNLVVAAQLGAMMPLRRGLAWLACQIALGSGVDLYFIATVVKPDDMAGVLLNCMLERLVQVLAFGVGCMVKRDRHTRLTLTATNAELRATQSLLADMVRCSERERIARDLHDVVGHHLTALGLHLDLAQRQAEPKASESIRVARGLAHDMLAEVRAMVGSERRGPPPDLHAALATLCSGIPVPAIRLTVEPGIEVHSAATAHALFCCVLEGITNAVRHADATALEIDLVRRGGQLVLTLADNGRGACGRAEGNGLRGMRERLAPLGGTLATGGPRPGFGIAVTLPCSGVAA